MTRQIVGLLTVKLKSKLNNQEIYTTDQTNKVRNKRKYKELKSPLWLHIDWKEMNGGEGSPCQTKDKLKTINNPSIKLIMK